MPDRAANYTHTAYFTLHHFTQIKVRVLYSVRTILYSAYIVSWSADLNWKTDSTGPTSVWLISISTRWSNQRYWGDEYTSNGSRQKYERTNISRALLKTWSSKFSKKKQCRSEARNRLSEVIWRRCICMRHTAKGHFCRITFRRLYVYRHFELPEIDQSLDRWVQFLSRCG